LAILYIWCWRIPCFQHIINAVQTQCHVRNVNTKKGVLDNIDYWCMEDQISNKTTFKYKLELYSQYVFSDVYPDCPIHSSFQPFNFESTRRRLFQKRVVCTYFYWYVCGVSQTALSSNMPLFIDWLVVCCLTSTIFSTLGKRINSTIYRKIYTEIKT
jgi:hypothetical protein